MRRKPRCVRKKTAQEKLDYTVEMNLTQGHCFGPWDLQSRTEFARPWSIWRDEISRRWIAGFPGSRPMAAYLLGEIAPPSCRTNSTWQATRKIEGINVVMPGNWHKQHLELLHLDELGLIDDEEWDRAIERLDSADATYHTRYAPIAEN